jgi:hypothetical protein
VNIPSKVAPGRAIAYARHPSGSPSRSIPFVIWLVVVLGVLMVIRKNGQGTWQPGADLPASVVTYVVAGGAIVLVATVAPEIVTHALMVLVLLAFLIDVPYLTPAFDKINSKIKTLSPA